MKQVNEKEKSKIKYVAFYMPGDSASRTILITMMSYAENVVVAVISFLLIGFSRHQHIILCDGFLKQ